MSDQFLGEIRPFAFNFAPQGWALCQGQTLAISQYSALFALIGTYYGGNGTTTFLLPNLQSCVPLSQGTSIQGGTYPIGEFSGAENVTVTMNTMPMHTHTFSGMGANGNDNKPVAAAALANSSTGALYYGPATSLTNLNSNAVSLMPPGGGQPHNNIQPSLAINWCIAMSGIFPTRG
jgi:microcystin-dependent protein